MGKLREWGNARIAFSCELTDIPFGNLVVRRRVVAAAFTKLAGVTS